VASTPYRARVAAALCRSCRGDQFEPPPLSRQASYTAPGPARTLRPKVNGLLPGSHHLSRSPLHDRDWSPQRSPGTDGAGGQPTDLASIWANNSACWATASAENLGGSPQARRLSRTCFGPPTETFTVWTPKTVGRGAQRAPTPASTRQLKRRGVPVGLSNSSVSSRTSPAARRPPPRLAPQPPLEHARREGRRDDHRVARPQGHVHERAAERRPRGGQARPVAQPHLGLQVVEHERHRSVHAGPPFCSSTRRTVCPVTGSNRAPARMRRTCAVTSVTCRGLDAQAEADSLPVAGGGHQERSAGQRTGKERWGRGPTQRVGGHAYGGRATRGSPPRPCPNATGSPTSHTSGSWNR
jgi:hypothetical protein